MNKIKNSGFFRIISLALILTFISLDISYAYPPEHTVDNSTLAVPSLLQQQPVNEQAARFQQSLFSESKVLGSIFSIAKYLFDDNLPIRYMDQVLSAELGKAVEGIDLSQVIVKDGVILVPCEIKDKKRIMQIALKGSPAAKNLVGYEWPASDKYVIKEAGEKNAELVRSQLIAKQFSLQPLTKEFAETYARRLTDLHNLIEGSNWVPQQLTSDMWKKGEYGWNDEKIFYAKWRHSLVANNDKGYPIGLLIVYERPGHEYKTFDGKDARVDGPVLYVHTVAVDESYRGMGVASTLLRQTAENLQNRGFAELRKEYRGPPILTVQTNIRNLRAQSVYEKLGFRKIGVKGEDYVYSTDSSAILRKSSELAQAAPHTMLPGRQSASGREGQPQFPALPVKIAFFDWDGTISDTASLTLEVFKMLYPIIMPGGSDEEAVSVFHSKNLDGLVLEQQYDILADIAKEKGVELTIPKFGYINRYESEKVKLIGEKAREVNGACSFIRHLLDHGVSVYIVSAMLRKELVKQVEAFGLVSVVHGIFGGPSSEEETTSFAKSKSEYMSRILKEKGISPGDAVMFGDTVRDRRSAEEAGVLFVGRAEDAAKAVELSDGGKWPAIRDFSDTPQVLKNIEAAQVEKIRAIGNGADIESLIESLNKPDSVEAAILREVYGEGVLELQRKRYITALEHFRSKYPQTREIAAARSGGRVIVAGHHSAPHLGHILNYPTHEDTIVIAGLNPNTAKDSVVRAGVAPSPSFKEGSFEDAEFSIASIPESARDIEKGPRWWEYIEQVIGQIKNTEQAPRHIPNLDILVDGRPEYGALPISAGISSSAALDIAVFYAVTELLGIQHKIKADEFSAYAQNVEYNLGHLAGKDDQHGSQRGGFPGQGALLMSNIPLVDDDGRIMLESEPVPFPPDYTAILFDTGVHGEEAWPEFAVRLVEGETGTFLLYQEFKKRFPGIFEDKTLVNRVYPDLDNRQQNAREEYPPFFKPYFFSLPALGRIGLNIGKDELLNILNKLPESITYEELKNGAFSSNVELLDSLVKKLAQYNIDLSSRRFNPRGTTRHAILEQSKILESIKKLRQAMASSNEADRERLMREFGQIQRETFYSLAKDYRNLDKSGKIAALADILHADPNVLGAVHPGAGWGGRVCAWVHIKDVDKVIDNVISKGYYTGDPRKTNPQAIIVSGPGYGASVIFSRDRLEELNYEKRIAKQIAGGTLETPKVTVKRMFRAHDIKLDLNTISEYRRRELIKAAYGFFLKNPGKKITRSIVAGGISSRIKKGKSLPKLIEDAQREAPERFGRNKAELPECRVLYPIARIVRQDGSVVWVDSFDYYMVNIEKMNDNFEKFGLGRPFMPRIYILKRYKKSIREAIDRGRRSGLHRWNVGDVLLFSGGKESHPTIAPEALVTAHRN